MRLAYASDLHSDLCQANADFLSHLATHLQRQAPDVFVIAGDLAETVAAVESSLNVFRDVPGEHVYLPGNHDLFAEGAAQSPHVVTSRDKFETLLPEAVQRAGFHYMGLEPLRLAGVEFVGVPGWYDFTLRDPALDAVIETRGYRAGIWRGQRAYDRGHVLWPTSKRARTAGEFPTSLEDRWAGDEEILEHMLERLEAQLAQLTPGSVVIAVIHVVPFAQLALRGAFGVSGFFDAYLGSQRIGARLQRQPGVRAVISGHLHRAQDVRIGNIRAVSRPLGDARKHTGSLDVLAASQVGWLEIDL